MACLSNQNYPAAYAAYLSVRKDGALSSPPLNQETASSPLPPACTPQEAASASFISITRTGTNPPSSPLPCQDSTPGISPQGETSGASSTTRAETNVPLPSNLPSSLQVSQEIANSASDITP